MTIPKIKLFQTSCALLHAVVVRLQLKHYHLEVQANPQKMAQKKPMLFLASMGETGLSHDIFFKFSARPFKVAASKFLHDLERPN